MVCAFFSGGHGISLLLVFRASPRGLSATIPDGVHDDRDDDDSEHDVHYGHSHCVSSPSKRHFRQVGFFVIDAGMQRIDELVLFAAFERFKVEVAFVQANITP